MNTNPDVSSRKFFRVFLFLSSMCGCFLSFNANADTYCKFSDIYTDSTPMPLNVTGMSTVGEDVPVGKILAKATFNTKNRPSTFRCYDTEIGQAGKTAILKRNYSVISTPSGSGTPQADGRIIYPTNVPGIGVIIDNGFGTALFPSESEQSLYYSNTSWTITDVQILPFTVWFIKTGNIPAGTQQILGSSLPTLTYTAYTNSVTPALSNTFNIISFSGSVTMYTKTCQLETSDIKVNLGEHDTKIFDGVGATSPWKDFSINLKGCPPFYGYSSSNYSGDSGNAKTSTLSNNSVGISFKSLNGINANNNKIANIDGAPDSAKGIGIELSQKDVDELVPLDGSEGFEQKGLTTQDNATYNIPLKARYVQTSSSVQPGTANGAVTFTIIYQ